MDFNEIPPFTRGACYAVDISLNYLPRAYLSYVHESGLNVSPDFQRPYVWTEEQKSRFMEFRLRGGTSGKDIYMNNPNWKIRQTSEESFVLVDGKQRLDAALGFLNNEVKAFGRYFREFTGHLRMHRGFRFHVNDLATRHEVLQWYLELNASGTPHSPEEIARVRTLLADPTPVPRVPHEIVLAHANLSREVLQAEVRQLEVEKEALAQAAKKALTQPIAKKRKGR